MLSKDHFYWEMVKKYIVAFYHIFEDIHVLRYNADGSLRKDITVPVSFVGKQKMFYLMERRDDIGGSISTVLPRLSFNIVAMTPNDTRKVNPQNQQSVAFDGETEELMYAPNPYDFQFQLSIWSMYASDLFQMIEQAATFFRPDYTMMVQEIDDLDIRRKISIVLQDVNLDIQNDFQDEQDRVLTADINFVLKGFLYPPIDSAGIIKLINVRFTDYNDRCIDMANIEHKFNELCAFEKEAEGATGSTANIEFETDSIQRFAAASNITTNTVSDIENSTPIAPYEISLFSMQNVIAQQMFPVLTPYNSPDEVSMTVTDDIFRLAAVVSTIVIQFTITNIEFLNGVVWESKFDDTHWTVLNGTWNGSAWDSVGAGAAVVQLEAIGTWAVGYTPTKVRLTIEAQ